MKIDSSVVIERTVVPSVTIKISRKDLWYQFMESLADIMWQSEISDSFIKIDVVRVANTLTVEAANIQYYADKICGLFTDYTAFLLGDLMKEIDNKSVKHYEIIVTDEGAEPVVVPFHKIVF